MQRDNFRTRGFNVWRLCTGDRACAPHRGKEEMGKHSARYLAECSWAGCLFSSLIIVEPPERDKRIDHVQLNEHFLIQIASNRVTPIITFVAVKRHSYILRYILPCIGSFEAEIELTRNSVTWIERNVYVGITWDCTWWSTCTRERWRVEAKILGQVFCMSIVVRFVVDFNGFLGDSF